MAWLGVAAAGAAVEAHALRTGRHEHTLSATTRRVLRTDHPAGALTFGAGLGWFAFHILRPHNQGE